MSRVIKVEKCRECEYFGIAKEGYEHTCRKMGKIVEPNKIPDSCPLAKCPSVTDKDIDYFCEEMELALTSHSGKGSEQRNLEESYLKWLFEKIGVEIKEVRDENK